LGLKARLASLVQQDPSVLLEPPELMVLPVLKVPLGRRGLLGLA
jgi:hypothetical protein